MYTKSVLTKMKNDLVARLAAQVAEFYEKTYTLVSSESLKVHDRDLSFWAPTLTLNRTQGEF